MRTLFLTNHICHQRCWFHFYTFAKLNSLFIPFFYDFALLVHPNQLIATLITTRLFSILFLFWFIQVFLSFIVFQEKSTPLFWAILATVGHLESFDRWEWMHWKSIVFSSGYLLLTLFCFWNSLSLISVIGQVFFVIHLFILSLRFLLLCLMYFSF